MRKIRNKALAPAALWRQMRGGRFILAEHDGDLWWSNAYQACRLTNDPLDAVADLLALYNLKPEPMVCDAGQTLVRNARDTPDVGVLVEKMTKEKLRLATRHRIGSSPVLVQTTKGEGLEVWSFGSDDDLVFLNPAYRALTDLLVPAEGLWFGVNGTKPMVKRDGKKGRVLAMQMPVRHEPLFHEARSAA